MLSAGYLGGALSWLLGRVSGCSQVIIVMGESVGSLS